MNNDQNPISIKNIWLYFNGLLLATIGVSWMFGWDAVINICGVALFAMSFPLNLLIGWLFFAFDGLAAQPGVMMLMFLSFSWIGYVQWFKLVPKLAKFISSRFAAHDREVNINVSPKQITEPAAENLISNEWQPGIYDEQARTPVERVFSEK